MTDYLVIEPARGATYPRPGDPETFAVYSYGVYEDWSVLAGQEKRSYVDGGFPTAAAAKAAYPKAEVSEGTGYREVTVPHEPPAWFDEAAIGERWDDDY